MPLGFLPPALVYTSRLIPTGLSPGSYTTAEAGLLPTGEVTKATCSQPCRSLTWHDAEKELDVFQEALIDSEMNSQS